MKRTFTALLFTLLLTPVFSNVDHYCLTANPKSSVDLPSNKVFTEPCKVYMVNIYIHYIYGHPNANAYGAWLNQTILDNLNTSFSPYGISFRISGSRSWYHTMFSDPGSFQFQLQGVGDDPGAQLQSNAINIYVLPANSQIQGGHVPANNKKVLLIGGTRVVNHCVGGTKTYEIAKTRVISHEMGHCFGLVETHQVGDDGLADTSIDYLKNNECVNPNTCQFVPNCSSCNVASNPTTNMNNFMSYTVPTCMTTFTPMQLDLMRVNLNNSMAGVVHKIQAGTPNMQLMTYDNNKTVYTVNSVSAGTHYVYTNLDPLMLTSNISWSTNVGWVTPTGSKNVNATIALNAGQSMTVSLAATNVCGTATRNPAFTTSGGGWYFTTKTGSPNSLAVVFDDIQDVERLPKYITVYNSTTGGEEARIDVHNALASGQFNGNTLDISSDKLTPGVKIIKTFKESTVDPKNKAAKTERVFIPQ